MKVLCSIKLILKTYHCTFYNDYMYLVPKTFYISIMFVSIFHTTEIYLCKFISRLCKSNLVCINVSPRCKDYMLCMTQLMSWYTMIVVYPCLYLIGSIGAVSCNSAHSHNQYHTTAYYNKGRWVTVLRHWALMTHFPTKM